MGMRLVRFPKAQVAATSEASYGSGSGSNNVITVIQDNDFEIGDVVYCGSDGLYKRALAEDTPKIEAIGIVSNVMSDTLFDIIVSGKFDTDVFDDYDSGNVLYLSETDAGKCMKSPKKIRKPIAIKIPGGIILDIQRADMLGYYGSEWEEEQEEQENNDYYSKEDMDNLLNLIYDRLNVLEENGSGYNDGTVIIQPGGEGGEGGTQTIILKEKNYTEEEVKEAVKLGIKNCASLLSDVQDFRALVDDISNTNVWPEYDGVNSYDSFNKVVHDIDNCDLNALSAEDAEIQISVSNIRDSISELSQIIRDINNEIEGTDIYGLVNDINNETDYYGEDVGNSQDLLEQSIDSVSNINDVLDDISNLNNNDE